MKLTNKEKKYLKGLATNLNAIIHVGKEGVTTNLIITLKDSLFAHELVKIKLLTTVAASSNEIAIELATASNSDIIQIIGRTIVLYKRSPEGRINFL